MLLSEIKQLVINELISLQEEICLALLIGGVSADRIHLSSETQFSGNKVYCIVKVTVDGVPLKEL